MKAADWIDLVQKFPPAEFDGFGLYLESGMEVTMQNVLQLNSDHMLIRGRNVGSADAGRYFYIPYDKIICVVYNRPIKEEIVLSWYDGAPSVALPPAVETERDEEEAGEESPAVAPAPIRPGARPALPTTVRPAIASIKPSPTPPPGGVVRPGATIHPTPVAANQQVSSGLQQTGNLANAQNNPIKTALLERLRARRQGQDPPSPEKK